MKYIIKTGFKDNGRIKWSYYNGNTYKRLGEYFIDDFFTTQDKAQRYLDKKVAEKVAEKLCDKCSNVDVWLLEEVKE